ncbi:uncharacterized protein LOC142238211 [Haematobia irritans]|uniref:uncharacterized protein LOC142238211 n=1 Tax=Haematobia irritans TaxID=7368 RepID=UPI003F4F596F
MLITDFKYTGLLIILSYMIVTRVWSIRTFSLDFQSYHHEIVPGFYKSANFQLVNYSTYTVFDGCGIFLKDIKNFNLKVMATGTRYNGQNFTAVNVTFDACKLLENQRSQASFYYINLLLKSVLAGSPTIPRKCPLKKENDYCFANFSLKNIRVPGFLPMSKFYVLFAFQEKKLDFFKGFFEVKVLQNT